MDNFANPIDPSLVPSKQTSVSDGLFKERTHRCKRYVTKWLYAHGIPFNAINNDDFLRMVQAIGQFGPLFSPPTQYELREKLLKEEVDETKKPLKPHEEERALTRCSIMTDAWTDQKRRSIMNLCVHCSLGTSFLRPEEVSDESHTSEFIFNYVDGCIEEIGPQNVVQIVTDNASNNMGAKTLLKGKRPNIFWSSYATHTVNLMLQAIGNMPRYKKTIGQAKAMTIFIYAHHKTLALMRKHTKRRDIVRPGVTRFASSFLTFQSLIDKKTELKNMAVSMEWEDSPHTKKGKGKAATSTILKGSFWKGVNNIIKVFEPLVKVLRMVDGDDPSMAFLYGEIIEAKKQIKEAMNNLEDNYKLVIGALDKNMKGRLDSPLHMACFLLNPYYTYRD